jgi:hypothetical protein
MYNPPKGGLGQRVVSTMAREFTGVRERKWNSERALIFAACVLRKSPGVVRARDIKRRVERRLNLWIDGQYDALVQDIVGEAMRGVGSGRGTVDEELIARKYNSMVLDGKLRAAVRFATERDGGGVLLPQDACTKTGRPVMEVLLSQHPDTRIPNLEDPNCIAFEQYSEVPVAMPTDCTPEDLETLALRMSGSAGPSSFDAVMLRNCLLRYGRASGELRQEMADWVEWLSNESPPWAAYRALMCRRLVALDKQPGVRPLAIGEIWQRCIAKGNLAGSGAEAKGACGSTQLCAGLEAGIEGALHAVRLRAETNGSMRFRAGEIDDDLWEDEREDGEDPPWTAEAEGDLRGEWEDGPEGLTLVDARNGFNELSRYAMLWTARHRWPKGARFSFNCYKHYARCLVRNPGCEPSILLSREGVTQGCPQSGILYGLGLLPLAEYLRRDTDPQQPSNSTVLQPWYADDMAMMGAGKRIARVFKLLMEKGPSVGYFPEPAKSYHICPKEEEAEARAAFEEAGLHVNFCRGKRYVGGFVGSEAMLGRWLDPKVKKWVEGVEILARIASRFPQTAYAGLASSLQAEWQYICRVIPGAEHYLGPIESAICEKFIPALLQVSDPVDDVFRQLLSQGVKFGGIALRNPVTSAPALHQSSIDACDMLIKALHVGGGLNAEAHKACVKAAGNGARKVRMKEEEGYLDGLKVSGGRKMAKRLDRMGETGAWLSAIPNRFDGTELSREEFQDNLAIRYGLRPRGLPERCDGCNEPFSVEHGISCKKGGFVGQRHDDVCEELAHLCSMALTPSRISSEPEIFYGRELNAAQRNANEVLGDEARGDVGAHGFWKRGRTTIFDVQVCDTDAKSYGNRESKKVLESAARRKKDKYEEACLERRRDFTPMIYSVDGMADKHARAAEKRIAGLLAAKWTRQYSQMASFVRTRMCLAIVRSNTLLLRGDRAMNWRRKAPDDGVAVRAAMTMRVQ